MFRIPENLTSSGAGFHSLLKCNTVVPIGIAIMVRVCEMLGLEMSIRFMPDNKQRGG